MWKWLEQYFTFTKSEKNGILLLIFLSIAAFILPNMYTYFNPPQHFDNTQYDNEINAFIKEYIEKKQLSLADTLEEAFNPYANVQLSSHFKKKEKREIEYFDFDPNKIGVEEWIKLGFSEKQAESIERTKSKGWKFYKPEDLREVYVVGVENYNRLAPYIKIDPNDFPKKTFSKTIYAERAKEKFVLDINTADSSLFERQRGIGPAIASRIIRYRERLGGFVSKEQIKEVWGMPDSTYQSLKDRFIVNDISVRKMNVNSSDFETMHKHPYINYTYAKVIDAYRKQHGNFASVEGLKKIPVISDSFYQKLEPYISVE